MFVRLMLLSHYLHRMQILSMSHLPMQEQKGNHHDLYVFGHRHIELDLMLSRDSRLVILGDCWRMFTYVQLNENFEVIMMNYE